MLNYLSEELSGTNMHKLLLPLLSHVTIPGMILGHYLAKLCASHELDPLLYISYISHMSSHNP